MIIFGGDIRPATGFVANPLFVNDVWIYSLTSELWSNPETTSAMLPRGGHWAVLDSLRHRMIVFGGRTRQAGEGDFEVLADLWALDLETFGWTEITPEGASPEPRDAYRMVFDASKDRLVLFGGNADTFFASAVRGDTWEFSFSDHRWRELNLRPFPRPRQDFSIVFDSKQNRMIIFGGARTFSSYFNDVWAFDLTSDTWDILRVSGTPPGRRFWAGAVFDALRNRILTFGGHDLTELGNRNDVWSLDLNANTWELLVAGDESLGDPDANSPERRFEAVPVYDPARDRLILYGGESDFGLLDDIWAFDLSSDSWTEIRPATSGEDPGR